MVAPPVPVYCIVTALGRDSAYIIITHFLSSIYVRSLMSTIGYTWPSGPPHMTYCPAGLLVRIQVHSDQLFTRTACTVAHHQGYRP